VTIRLTKFGVEVLGYAYPPVVVDPFANTIFPLISEGDWRGEFSIETIWQTAISKSQSTGAEEREGRVSRPTRILRTLCTGMSRSETTRMLANAFSQAGTRYPAAIYPDFTFTTNSSTTSLLCDTSYKRFFPGQRVAVLPENYSLSATHLQAQLGIIDYVTPDEIKLLFPLDVACAAGDIVFPLADCQIKLSQELNARTDAIAEWLQECVELSGTATLPGLSEEDVHYLGMSYYQGYPIFDLEPNWRDSVRVGVAREGASVQSGNTNIVSADGDPFLTFGGSFEEYDRAAIWRAGRFFDSRNGRLRPFWAVNPLVLFDIVSIPTLASFAVTTASASGQLTDLVKHVGIRYTSGALQVIQVTSIVNNVNGTTTINLIEDMAVGVESVTSAHLSRFDQDSFKETWRTDEICQFDLNYRSLLDEATYAVIP